MKNFLLLNFNQRFHIFWNKISILSQVDVFQCSVGKYMTSDLRGYGYAGSHRGAT